MEFDYRKYRFPSRKSVVYGTNGMAATTQPLAAQAAVDVLKNGGNACDAVIAMAACMTVVEPTSNGLGSDAFALIWIEKEKKLYGINGSGWSSENISLEKVKALGIDKIPDIGWLPVNVSGCVGTWSEIHNKFGKADFESLMEPAISYAQNGYIVTPVISRMWETAYNEYSKQCVLQDGSIDEKFKEWFNVFAPNGRAPKAGELFKFKYIADTLKEIGKTHGESFYRGNIAKRIVEFSDKTGGFLTLNDYAEYKPMWVEPISTDYKGYEVCEIPPNGHGITALMALNNFEGFDIKDREDSYHKQIESMKLAFVDAMRYVSDSRFMKADIKTLLSKEYAAKRRSLIGEEAIMPEAGNPFCGGTVYMCCADKEGNMVSYIQSNYKGFGSAIVVPETGISLHDRGCNFYVDEKLENCIGPRKRPYHTIIPGFLKKDNEALAAFGVMGGFMQPQGHFQVVTNLLDFGMNPQEALDAPRWQWVGNKDIQLEMSFDEASAKELLYRGHNISVMADNIDFGRGQIIMKNEGGGYVGASEPRADGIVASW